MFNGGLKLASFRDAERIDSDSETEMVRMADHRRPGKSNKKRKQ